MSTFNLCLHEQIIKNISELIENTHSTQAIYEPRCEKTGLQGFRLGPTQAGLYNHTRWLEA